LSSKLAKIKLRDVLFWENLLGQKNAPKTFKINPNGRKNIPY
jgi:hypothetical protein